MPQLTPADMMLYTTVKLTTYKQGAVTGSGTAFFFRVPFDGDQQAILLVTNKHVLKDVDRVAAKLNIATLTEGDPRPSGQSINCAIDLQPAGMLMHPDDEVDLCAFNVSGLIEKATDAGKPIFFVNLQAENLPGQGDWENFDSIEEITMVGCPRGIFDETNNIPIVRRGISATPLSKQYNGKNRFMVDMACFPGSSGSPIFVYNRDGYLDRAKNTYMMGRTRFFLVGVLFSGPMITNQGDIILGQPPRVEVATMMHLGYALRSTELHVIERLAREKLGAT